ncbi:MAG: hypothetical protein HY644_11895 [Acidobacteria bacterium]|nr:hypothetical protein [Acidobacteriota bacterium]
MKTEEGVTLLEIMVALALSLTALLMATPALGLSMKILMRDQETFDQEVAFEAVWNEIRIDPVQFATPIRRECQVGTNRKVTVKVEPLDVQTGLRRWKLSVTDSSQSEERWLSK